MRRPQARRLIDACAVNRTPINRVLGALHSRIGAFALRTRCVWLCALYVFDFYCSSRVRSICTDRDWVRGVQSIGENVYSCVPEPFGEKEFQRLGRFDRQTQGCILFTTCVHDPCACGRVSKVRPTGEVEYTTPTSGAKFTTPTGEGRLTTPTGGPGPPHQLVSLAFAVAHLSSILVGIAVPIVFCGKILVYACLRATYVEISLTVRDLNLLPDLETSNRSSSDCGDHDLVPVQRQANISFSFKPAVLSATPLPQSWTWKQGVRCRAFFICAVLPNPNDRFHQKGDEFGYQILLYSAHSGLKQSEWVCDEKFSRVCVHFECRSITMHRKLRFQVRTTFFRTVPIQYKFSERFKIGLQWGDWCQR